MTGTGRPDLRALDGGGQDSVIRRRRFEEAHPEAIILPLPGFTPASLGAANAAGEEPW